MGRPASAPPRFRRTELSTIAPTRPTSTSIASSRADAPSSSAIPTHSPTRPSVHTGAQEPSWYCSQCAGRSSRSISRRCAGSSCPTWDRPRPSADAFVDSIRRYVGQAAFLETELLDLANRVTESASSVETTKHELPEPVEEKHTLHPDSWPIVGTNRDPVIEQQQEDAQAIMETIYVTPFVSTLAPKIPVLTAPVNPTAPLDIEEPTSGKPPPAAAPANSTSACSAAAAMVTVSPASTSGPSIPAPTRSARSAGSTSPPTAATPKPAATTSASAPPPETTSPADSLHGSRPRTRGSANPNRPGVDEWWSAPRPTLVGRLVIRGGAVPGRALIE